MEAGGGGLNTATPMGGQQSSMEFSENAEFDELISSLKTGDYFARRRSRLHSRQLEVSRERPVSAIELTSTREEA